MTKAAPIERRTGGIVGSDISQKKCLFFLLHRKSEAKIQNNIGFGKILPNVFMLFLVREFFFMPLLMLDYCNPFKLYLNDMISAF